MSRENFPYRVLPLCLIAVLAACGGDDDVPDTPSQRLVYQEIDSTCCTRVVRVSADGTDREVLFEGYSSGPLFVAPDNRIVFRSNGGWLMLQPSLPGVAVGFEPPSVELVIEGPYWSPTGALIAWILSPLNGPRTEQLAVALPNSAAYQLITDDSLSIRFASWSPDGTRLVFSATHVIDGYKRFYTISRTGTGLRQLTPDSINAGQFAAWSPDGSRIAFLADDRFWTGDIWTIAPDGTDIRRVTENAVSGLGLQYTTALHWAPSGLDLLSPDARTGNLIRINAASGAQTNLGLCCSPPFDPSSPDGSHLLYVVPHLVGSTGGTLRIGVALADGTGGSEVGPDLPAANPVWLSNP